MPRIEDNYPDQEGAGGGTRLACLVEPINPTVKRGPMGTPGGWFDDDGR